MVSVRRARPPLWRGLQSSFNAVVRQAALALLVGLLVLLAGCTSPLARFFATPTPAPTCAELHLCWTITPFCGPAVTPTPQPGSDIWYRSVYWPRNLAALTGFQPLALSGEPQGDLAWNKVILIHPSAQSAQSLLHISYRSWRGAPPGRTAGPNAFSLLAIEETTGALDPLSRVVMGSTAPTIAAQYATTVNGAPATVYHLAWGEASHSAYQGVEVLWHLGAVAVRVLAAGEVPVDTFRVMDPDNPQSALDIIVPTNADAYPGDGPAGVDTFLLGVAATVAPFTGCG